MHQSDEAAANHKDEEASLGSPRLTASRTAWPTNERSFGDGLNDDDKVSKVATLVPKVADPDNNRRPRFLEKDGSSNIQFKNISHKKRKLLRDMFTTLMDAGWTEVIVLFHMSFYITWLLFGCVYYAIGYFHDDFEPGHGPPHKVENPAWKPCVAEVKDFTDVFLFSLETQHSIGYGTREITAECPSAMFLMSIQSIFGTLIEAFMVGLVFAKLSKPTQRSKTVIFTKNAVVCLRDKMLCLMFRVGDMRHHSSLVGANLSVQLVQRKVTAEGEIFDEVVPIKITPDANEQPTLIIIWPLTLVHVIDKESPFYNYSASDLTNGNFELQLSIEGTIESTGLTFQARTSYLSNEILWGQRFESMMLYRRDSKKYQVNFAAFDSTFEVDTPKCSAFEWYNRSFVRSEYEKSCNQLDFHGQEATSVVNVDALETKLESA